MRDRPRTTNTQGDRPALAKSWARRSPIHKLARQTLNTLRLFVIG
ncbi:hypothetical protein [Altericista sp. CCNU0014]